MLYVYQYFIEIFLFIIVWHLRFRLIFFDFYNVNFTSESEKNVILGSSSLGYINIKER